MEEKLKLISGQIHWSLLVKTAVWVLGWWFLPFGLFLVLTFYLYFVPPLRSGQLFWPFFLILVLAFFWRGDAFMGLLLGVLVYLLFGIKDLIFVNRKFVLEVLSIFGLFLLSFAILERIENWFSLRAILGSAFLAVVFGLLFRTFKNYRELPKKVEGDDGSTKIEVFMIGVTVFIVFQLAFVLIVLPVPDMYKIALFFATIVAIWEILQKYLDGMLTKRRVLIVASVLLSIFVLLLVSNIWTF
jgi:hypothetical protein